MKAILILIFIVLNSLNVSSQWNLQSDILTPSSNCSWGQPIGINNFYFCTPSCGFYDLYDPNNCNPGSHYGQAIGSYFSNDSGLSWHGTYDPGTFTVFYDKPVYDNFYDTIYYIGTQNASPDFKISYDCGNTWNNGFTFFGNYPNLISLYNGNYGYAINDNDQLVKIDSNTCVDLSITIPVSFSSLKFLNDSVGFGCTEDEIYKTIDRGVTWSPVFSDTNGYFFNWKFFDDSLIFFQKYVYNPVFQYITWRSDDAGQNWIITNYPDLMKIVNGLNRDTLLGIYYPSYYAPGDTNFVHYIMRSDNSGFNWDSIAFIPGYNLIDIKMYSNLFGYAYAQKGNGHYYIFRTDSGLKNFVLAVPEISSSSFTEVYPNPFSNEFKITGWSKGTMQLFDACSKLVYESTIYQDNQNFEVDIPKGFYLLKLIDGNKQKVLRLIH
jgi:hypothetical protein